MNRKTQSPHPFRLHGFSLMELMIVVVIIIVLVAIGIPVASKMRANSQRNQCMQQVRAWGVAIGGYAADHDGKVAFSNWAQIKWDEAAASPYNHYWTSGSIDFAGQQDYGAFGVQLKMRHCPSVYFDEKNAKVNPPPTYAFIRPTLPDGKIAGGDGYRLSSIRNPARFMMFVEAIENSGLTINAGGEFSSKVKPILEKGPLLRHNYTVNALLGDFSVKPMSWKDIQKGTSYWTML